jgi:hypothetical protein
VAGIATGLLQGYVNSQGKGNNQQQDPVKSVMGLFNKKKQPPK